MLVEGLALCAALAGTDYGLSARALRNPQVVEVGPVASHSFALGAGLKVAGCAAGEIVLRGPEHKKARRVFRIAGVALGGAIAVHTLRVGREARR